MSSQTKIRFEGKAGEYFGIWIVNLLLTVLTLGIYSAWAKVRRKKYFYQNTIIEGVGFDYHARPVAILKGRILAVIAFVAYQVAIKFSPILGMIMLCIFIAALPWIFIRGMQFNARNSSHRGLRFDFNASYWQTAKVLLLYPVGVVLSLGLLFPLMQHRLNRLIYNHHRFGKSAFVMDAGAGGFYMIYLKLIGLLAMCSFVAGVVVTLIVMGTQSYRQNTAWNEPAIVQAAYVSNEFGHSSAKANLSVAHEHTRAPLTHANDIPHNTTVAQVGSGSWSAKTLSSRPGYLIMIALPLMLYGGVFFSMAAYIKSRTSNLLWNHTQIEHIAFSSHQRMRDLFWIYFSNMVVLILTVGFATPWAQIRLAKYRLEHLMLIGEQDWDQFVGEQKAAVRALGEELADMFDVDLSFG